MLFARVLAWKGGNCACSDAKRWTRMIFTCQDGRGGPGCKHCTDKKGLDHTEQQHVNTIHHPDTGIEFSASEQGEAVPFTRDRVC